jgi:hypothetical protein
VRRFLVAAIPHVIDQKDADFGHGAQRLARPFPNQMRRDHG